MTVHNEVALPVADAAAANLIRAEKKNPSIRPTSGRRSRKKSQSQPRVSANIILADDQMKEMRALFAAFKEETRERFEGLNKRIEVLEKANKEHKQGIEGLEKENREQRSRIQKLESEVQILSIQMTHLHRRQILNDARATLIGGASPLTLQDFTSIPEHVSCKVHARNLWDKLPPAVRSGLEPIDIFTIIDTSPNSIRAAGNNVAHMLDSGKNEVGFAMCGAADCRTSCANLYRL